jgi:hypothetical protein
MGSAKLGSGIEPKKLPAPMVLTGTSEMFSSMMMLTSPDLHLKHDPNSN